MHKFWQKNRIFLIPYFIFVLVSGIILLVFSKEEIHLAHNGVHSTFVDYFFRYATHLGHGLAMVAVILACLFVRFRYSLMFSALGFVLGLVMWFLKRVVFSGIARPVRHFEGKVDLHLVPDVKIHFMHSFPSGHTATAFALFFGLALLFRNPFLKFLSFCAALVAGYSRMYLSQHFLVDVVAGSVVGVLLGWLAYVVVERPQAQWLDKSLFDLNLRGRCA